MKRVLFTASLLMASLAHADALDGLRNEDAIDEISAARAADETGDLALARVLAGEGERETKLVAVRASSHASAPETLVPALVDLALSRDPSLAPEAAWALLELFERLTVRDLAAREVLTADVQKACAAFARVDDAKKPRADIALALATAATRCAELSEQKPKAE